MRDRGLRVKLSTLIPSQEAQVQVQELRPSNQPQNNTSQVHDITTTTTTTSTNNTNGADKTTIGVKRPRAVDTAPPASSCSSKLEAINNLLRKPPITFLSRNPDQIASSANVSLEKVYELRRKVANTIIEDDTVGHGQDAYNIRTGVNNILLYGTTTSQEEQSPSVSNKDELSDENESNIRHQHHQSFFKRFRHMYKPMLGATTALDGYLHAILTNQHAQTISLSTGSSCLDQLLTTATSTISNINSTTSFITSSLLPTNIETNNNFLTREEEDDDEGKASETKGGCGLVPGIVTEMYGCHGSGKTQIALSLATSAITHPSSSWTVHYLAAGGGSACLIPLARRLRHLCQVRLFGERNSRSDGYHTSNTGWKEREDIFERIHFTCISDGYQLMIALSKIEAELKGGKGDRGYACTNGDDTNGGRGNVLIILDSAPGCLSSNVYGGDGGSQAMLLGNSLLNEAGLALRRLSRMTNITKNDGNGRNDGLTTIQQCAVFVTNGIVSSRNISHSCDYKSNRGSIEPSSSSSKPALGEYWQAADVRVRLDFIDDMNLPTQCSASTATNTMNKSPTKNPTRYSSSSVRRIRAHINKSVSDVSTEEDNSTEFVIGGNGILDYQS